jgi:exosortase/archaeosortase family protein
MNSAAFCLQSMGIFAATTGNTLRVDQTDLAVGAQCSGLRMVTAFMVVGAVVALLIRRRLWEKILIFASSIPIAMLCNTVRITLVAVAAGVFAQGAGLHEIFHDTAGYAMMPLALAAVVIELWLLSKLVPATGQSPVNRKISMIWEST